MATDAVRIEGLGKLFPPVLAGWKAYVHAFAPISVPALRNVSFAVAPGEVVAIVGANGAGKSTLLRILTTLLLPTSGRAWVGGADVLSAPARVRRQLGFHGGSDASFYARMSARENLRFFAVLNNVSQSDAAARIDELAELCHLGTFLDQQVRALSTGTVNRLGLARAMLHRPSVLLLDEPTRSLDPFAATQLRNFLLEEVVRQQGTTLVFASHTLSEVAQLADRIALLDAGRLLAFEAPSALLQSTGAGTLEEALDLLVRHAGARQ